MEGYFAKELLGSLKFRLLWKFSELLTIVMLAKVMNLNSFGIAFFVIMSVSFLRSLVITRKNNENESNDYSAATVFLPLLGLVVSAIMLLLSLASYNASLSEIIRFIGILFLFSTFSIAPEEYYSSVSKIEKKYRAYFFSQLIMIASSLALFFNGFEYKAVFYGYIAFCLANTLQLWQGFPFMPTQSRNLSRLKTIAYDIWKNLPKKVLWSLGGYGIAFYAALSFGIEEFAYIYIAYTLGFFLYENATIFMARSLRNFFEKIKENIELFRFNLIRFGEYIALLVFPSSLFFIIFSKEIVQYFFGELWFPSIETIIFFILAGMAKGLSEYIKAAVNSKNKAPDRIKIFEIVVLVLSLVIFNPIAGFNSIGIAVFISSLLSSIVYFIGTSQMAKVDAFISTKEHVYIYFSGIVVVLLLGLLKEYIAINSMFGLLIMLLLGYILFGTMIFLLNKDLIRRFIKFIFNSQN